MEIRWGQDGMTEEGGVCVLEGWEGGKENGDEDCAGLGSRAAPPEGRFGKGHVL